MFEAARAIATSAGILNPVSLWHAAELLVPLTDPSRHAPEIVATAHAWAGPCRVLVKATNAPLAGDKILVAVNGA